MYAQAHITAFPHCHNAWKLECQDMYTVDTVYRRHYMKFNIIYKIQLKLILKRNKIKNT